MLTFSNAHTHHRNAPPYPYMNYKASSWLLLVAAAALRSQAVRVPPPIATRSTGCFPCSLLRWWRNFPRDPNLLP